MSFAMRSSVSRLVKNVAFRSLYTSPRAAIKIPDVSLSEFIFGNMEEFGNKDALICGVTGAKTTFEQIATLKLSIAAGLAARGFHEGDVLALFAPNMPQYGAVLHAAVSLGGVATLVNPLYVPGELQRQLTMTKAKFLVTIPAFVETATKAIALTGNAIQLLVMGTPEFTALASTKTAPPQPIIDPRHIAVLPMSSGTTGLPKAVQLTHTNLVANTSQLLDFEGYNGSETFLAVLPYFHIYGFTCLLNVPLRCGAKTVILPKFDLELYLQLIQTHKVTHLHVAPPICVALAKHPMVDKYDLSSVRLILSGAAPLGPDLQSAVADRLKCIVKQGYGMTESSPVTHIVPNVGGKPGSIGQLVANTEAKLVIEGRQVKIGEEGEMCIRGPQVMKGYLNNPVADSETLMEDGWLRTGDLCKCDEEGNFFITDRLKELIKYKAFQVPPAELENILLSHPKIADAIVFPMPDTDGGEVPRAWVVKRNPDLTVEEVLKHVAVNSAPYKHLRGGVKFVDAVPKSAAGKLLRRVAAAEDAPKKN